MSFEILSENEILKIYEKLNIAKEEERKVFTPFEIKGNVNIKGSDMIISDNTMLKGEENG